MFWVWGQPTQFICLTAVVAILKGLHRYYVD
uniref:Uncharacterized protein n=1 Tax=Arundo donax TaxID=35708 RepID=A0A0A9GZS6_ARUDO